MRKLLHTVVLPAFLVLLAGCGFHLRGTGETESQVESLLLVSQDPYGELTQTLRKNLEKSGTRLVENHSDAQLALNISSERFSRRGVTTTRDISVAEYEIRLEADLEFYRRVGTARVNGGVEPGVDDNPDAHEDKFLSLPKATLYAERVYSFDATSLVSNSEEEALLVKEMRQELIGQIIWRINKALTRLLEKNS